MQKKKTAPEQLRTAQELLNVEDIQGKILWTKDKYLFAYIQCRGADNSLLSETDHNSVTEALTLALSEQTEPFQILSIPRTVDTQGMLTKLRQLRQETDSDTRLKLLTGEITALEELAEDGAKEPLIILKIWVPASRNADRALMERADILVSRLSNNGVAASVLDDERILRLCTIYAELGIWQRENEDGQDDIPILPGKKRRFSRKENPEVQAHNALMEQITPAGGMNFQATSAWIGAALCRCYGAIRYPSELDYGWAVRFMGATDCITCITYYPGQASEIGDALSRSIRASARDAAEESDARRKKRYERKANDADRLIDNLDARGMSLGHVSVVVMPWAANPEELEQICRNVCSRFAARRIKLKLLSCVQREAWMHLSPYYPNQKVIDDILKRIIPLETLMGGYPFTANILRDDNGVYFARTPDRGIVSLDIFYRDQDRTNGNGIVTGIPGVGKSTLLKSMLESMYMLGVKCIVIDPEREFKDLCRSMGGSWLDAGGGKARVNPLQIQASVQDEEEEDQKKENPGGDTKPKKDPEKQTILHQHIQGLQTIFQYKIRSLTDIQMSLLEKALLELYADFGITLDSDESCLLRSNTQWPIMEDLWHRLQAKVADDDRYSDLALLLETMAVGADSAIWNGYTNISLDNNLIVIDTYALHTGTERNRVTQYYNLMRMAFTAASADKDTPYFIICDEAQTMFDPELPQAAQALKNMALRLRKYEGCLWLAFHSLHELLDDKVRLSGQPILDAAEYKILFGTDGRNLADTVNLFKLTPAEEKGLEAKQRGKALALIGSRHMRVEFDLPQYRLDLMGRGGGR
ncbi:MAG: hypothetical protein J6J18_06590 [Oscillospiraceae bacterium]|nr:hypothetical protein [Oscillospiraceae bacterium]